MSAVRLHDGHDGHGPEELVGCHTQVPRRDCLLLGLSAWIVLSGLSQSINFLASRLALANIRIS